MIESRGSTTDLEYSLALPITKGNQMSALERSAPDGARRGGGIERDDMSHDDGRAGQPVSVTWSYTLAHAETPLRERALSERDLGELADLLRSRDIPLPAGFASPRARARLTSVPGGPRYIWGFTALDDALRAARANRRSDYHAYSEPTSLREASLDRLYRRFPLDDFPRATVILFSGAPVCSDPLLGPDPAPGSLAAELATALGPEAWERFTLLGFRQGATLVRVTPGDRWVRLSPRALEDAWDTAGRALTTPLNTLESGDAASHAEDDVSGMNPYAGRFAPPDPKRRESAAFQALLRILASSGETAPAPLPTPPARARKPRAPRTRRANRPRELRG